MGEVPTPPVTTRGPSATRVFVIVWVGSLAAVGVLHRVRSAEVAQLEQTVRRESARHQELGSVHAQSQEYQRRIRDLNVRMNTVDFLIRARTSPTTVLGALARLGDQAHGVELYSVSSERGRLALRGQARSVDAMTNFVTLLQRSSNFRDLDLRQFYERSDPKPPAYRFDLGCTYSETPPPPPPKR